MANSAAPTKRKKTTAPQEHQNKKSKHSDAVDPQAMEEERDTREKKLQREGKLKPTYPDYHVFVVDMPYSAPVVGKIAGYLQCTHKSELDEMIHTAPFDKVLDRLYRVHEDNWTFKLRPGSKEKSPSLQPPKLFDHLENHAFDAATIAGEVEMDEEIYPRQLDTKNLRMYAHVLQAIYAMIQAAPQHFPGPFQPQFTHKYVCGMEAEDVYRGLVLWSLYRVKRGASKKDDQVRIYQTAPLLPLFAESTRGPALSAAEESTQQANISALYENERLRMVDQADYVNKLLQPKHVTSGEVDASVDSFAQNEDHIRLDPSVPDISTFERSLLIEFHANMSIPYTLFNNRNAINPIYNPSDSVEELKKQALHDAEDARAFEEVASDERLKTHEDREKARAAFNRLSRAANKQSAAAPKWEDVLKELPGLKVVELTEPHPVTKQMFNIIWRGVDLMTWQPQGATFLLRMLVEMGTGLLADETGLGKTVTSLIALYEYASKVQEELDKWKELRASALEEGREEYVKMYGVEPEDNKKLEDFIQHNENAILAKNRLDQLPDKPRHRPTLLAVPPSALAAWMGDIRTFFSASSDDGPSIRLRYFSQAGTRSKASGSTKRHITLPVGQVIQGGRKGLKAFLEEQNDEDIQTTRTVILVTFQSWHKAVLERHKVTKVQDSDASVAAHDGDPEDAESNDEEGSDEEEEDESKEHDEDVPTKSDKGSGSVMSRRVQKKTEQFNMDAVTFVIPAKSIGVVIIDEAHRVKNPQTFQTQALYNLEDSKYILCTATPFRSCVQDFAGLLRFFWKNVAELIPEEERKKPLTVQEYKELDNVYRKQYASDFFQVDDEKIKQSLLRAINPVGFSVHVGGQADLEIGAQVIPLPTGLTTLRRVRGEALLINGSEIELGVDIPHYEIHYQELRQFPAEAAAYRAIHEEVMYEGGTVAFDEDHRPLPSPRARRLRIATVCPLLDQLTQRKVDITASTVHTYAEKGISHFAFLHRFTCPQSWVAPCATRPHMLQYIVGSSVKLTRLLWVINEVVIKRQEKLIIYADLPLILWVIELILTICGIKYGSIRAGLLSDARQQAAKEYNSPDSGLEVLVCSSRSAAESLNLQRGGRTLVVVDIVSCGVLEQLIGRVSRIGQQKVQHIYVLFADETYDQLIQSNAFRRKKLHIAGSIDIPQHLRDLAQRAMTDSELKDLHTDMAKGAEALDAILRSMYIESTIRTMYGVRSSQDGWAWERNPQLKNLLPLEVIFRYSRGGNVARELFRQLREDKAPAPPPKLEKVLAEKSDDSIYVRTVQPRLSALCQLLVPRPNIDANSIVQNQVSNHIIDAARKLSREWEYRVKSYGVLDIIRAYRKAWGDNDNFLEQAEKHYAGDNSEDLSEDLSMDVTANGDLETPDAVRTTSNNSNNTSAPNSTEQPEVNEEMKVEEDASSNSMPKGSDEPAEKDGQVDESGQGGSPAANAS